MEQAGTMNLDIPVVHSYLKSPENQSFRYEHHRQHISLEKTVNNYLKTSAEMDAEFSMEMNTAKLMTWKQVDTYERHHDSFYKAEQFNNTYSPDSTPLGFMEENY
jgi:hypothetical protein